MVSTRSILSFLVLSAASASASLYADDDSNVVSDVVLELNTASPFAKVTEGYAGVCMSFMDSTQIGGSDPTWDDSAMTLIDLHNDDFNNLLKALSPAILRVGGGNEYSVVYDVNGNECADKNVSAALDCLNMTRWEETLTWAKETEVKMVWGLGAQVSSMRPHDEE